jgi:NADPH:quinone reductase-like Zn-dependent oxidoreductase
MKAAIVTAPQTTPIYADFDAPKAREGYELITVKACALTHLTKGRASGSHYSSDNAYPSVVGVDGTGVTATGRRVYFALPEAPFGAMAEQTLVRSRQLVDIPADLDDITAAALANPGMSVWAALMDRANFKSGEVVAINGATGSAGRLAVQIARHLGASKIIATGRNKAALDALGADVVIPFDSNTYEGFENAMIEQFSQGVDVIIDYLWGKTAEIIMIAIAKGVDDAKPVRFVQVGSLSGDTIQLPSAALRSSSAVLMGSGLKSVPFANLLEGIRQVFSAAILAKLTIDIKKAPLSDVNTLWDDEGKSRIVFIP